MSGQTSHRVNISAMTNAKPCVVTTATVHGFETSQMIRFTGLNSMIPVKRGQDPINNNKYRIIVIDTTSFSLYDQITDLPIDSTNYPPYVTGGQCNLVEQVFIYNGD